MAFVFSYCPSWWERVGMRVSGLMSLSFGCLASERRAKDPSTPLCTLYHQFGVCSMGDSLFCCGLFGNAQHCSCTRSPQSDRSSIFLFSRLVVSVEKGWWAPWMNKARYRDRLFSPKPYSGFVFESNITLAAFCRLIITSCMVNELTNKLSPS